ncbi:hypothetical protein Tsubulata_008939 [Turnera subulata]|uniref:Core Histone H2A/H2B/H3 domain-containing protein n=1 Tax=Turnera subulata TaxID=218843 RepID=A0A9Q0EZD4_9ROSI|nr:hypothetical protein Tsubulata_008939 [Turnera subulata]
MDLNQTFELNALPTSPSPSQFGSIDGQDSEETGCSHFKQVQNQTMETFWNQQLSAIYNITEYKNNQLPLARIKKLMKADENVKMISADTPVVFAKACEIFIKELTLRGWLQTEDCNRRTLQRCDIARAIHNSEDTNLHFLLTNKKTKLSPYCNHKDGDFAKYFQECAPCIPTHQWPSPSPVGVNRADTADHNEIPPQPKTKRPMLPGSFNYDSTSK